MGVIVFLGYLHIICMFVLFFVYRLCINSQTYPRTVSDVCPVIIHIFFLPNLPMTRSEITDGGAGEIEIRVYHSGDDSSMKQSRIGMVTVPILDVKAAKSIPAW